MKRPFLALLLLVGLAVSTVEAQTVSRTNSTPSVSFGWNISTDPTVGGYNLYQGGSSGNYTNVVNIPGGSTATFTQSTGLVRGQTYFWAITAVATNGLESVYSNEVTYQVPSLPGPPTTVTIKMKSP